MDLSVLETPSRSFGHWPGTSDVTVKALMITASVASESDARKQCTCRPEGMSNLKIQRSIVDTKSKFESSGQKVMETGEDLRVMTLDIR
jgi:hypothetical protein